MALDGVGRDEVEDQAVFRLAVAMDASHPLFQPVGVPRDVVVEQDVAALEVDAFAGRLGRDQDLDRAFAELLFGVQPRAGLVPRADVHAAVDGANAETPLLQFLDEIVERVLELGEDKKPLLRVVEETLLLQQFLSRESFASHPASSTRIACSASSLSSSISSLTCSGFRARVTAAIMSSSRSRSRFFHLVQFFRVGQVGRSVAGDLLSLLQHLSQPLGRFSSERRSE